MHNVHVVRKESLDAIQERAGLTTYVSSFAHLIAQIKILPVVNQRLWKGPIHLWCI